MNSVLTGFPDEEILREEDIYTGVPYYEMTRAFSSDRENTLTSNQSNYEEMVFGVESLNDSFNVGDSRNPYMMGSIDAADPRDIPLNFRISDEV